MSQEEFMNSPLKFGGVLSPAFDIAGVMIQEIKDENNEYLTEALQQNLEEAKSNGLDAVREFVNNSSIQQIISYEIYVIQNSISLTKLLNKEFTNIDELIVFDRQVSDLDRTFYLLIKNIDDKFNVIETIYFDI